MNSPLPDWLEGTTRKDWLCDGYPCSEERWSELDWSKAWADIGPSPAGNPGPYWHVPLKNDDTVHRMYPRLLKSKWLLVVRRAIEELTADKR